MKVCVVVVSYNGMKWIEECLSSILNSSIETTIIVVDNCSKDGTVDYIKTNFKTVKLLEQKENLGFGKGNNIGISYALKVKTDYVFLLNQDAFIDKDTISNLINAAYKNPQFGILSPIQLNYSGNLLEEYFFNFMAKDKTRSFYSDFVLKNKLQDIYNIEFVQAASWLIPVAAIMKIGGFDPIFFHYGEDNNYCQRMLYHNLQIGIVSNAYMRHDANKHNMEQISIFSEKYFILYERNLKVLFANINQEFNENNLRYEKRKVYKELFFSILKLNFTKMRGFSNKLRNFEKTINKILISRKTNKIINTHYLDD
ncbi:GT2 family glycosyltransferase [Flavobacterium sp. 7E]|uniref:glycosyltransferase family 2 protein n=1 Tax=Flavobacterium sp. 7E TaxID=2735898 RepID=UPI001571509B|nr:glycosyltransferase family 2 protein [Flavobacterium sp. 7E]NRS89394.1 GT2 family glycosyltransferase [Flavobacterium sp. 7E]